MEKAKRKNNEEANIRLWTWKRFIGVIAFALLYGFIALATAMYANGSFETAYISFLLGIPVAIGALSIYTIPPQFRTFWRIYWMSLTTILLFACVAAVYAPFALFCIVIASPLIAIAAWKSVV